VCSLKTNVVVVVLPETPSLLVVGKVELAGIETEDIVPGEEADWEVTSDMSSCVTNTVVVLTGGAGVLATVTDFSVVVSAGAVVAVTSPLRVVLVSTFVVVGWTVFVVVTSTTGVVDSDT